MPRQPTTDRRMSGEIAKLWEAIQQLRNKSSLSGTAMGVASSATGATVRRLGPLGDAGGDVEVTGPGGDSQRVTTVRGVLEIPGGSVLLVDGGDVVMTANDNSELLRLGVQVFGDRGIQIKRNDGTVALHIKKLFSPGDSSQVFQLLDRDNRVIAGDAGLSTQGFDAPHMHLAFIPTNYDSSANAQSTSSATFVATHEHRGFKQNPFFRPQFMVKCSDGTTAGEIKVWNAKTSAYLIGFFAGERVATIPAGTTSYTLLELDGSCVIPGRMSEWVHLQFHVRRTAGTGTITVAPVRTVAGNVNDDG